MNVIERRCITYLLGASTYGAVRKAYQVSNATEDVYDASSYTHRKVPMLFVDKCMLVGVSILITPTLAPVFVYEDMRWLEMRTRKADPVDYGYNEKKHVFDYLF